MTPAKLTPEPVTPRLTVVVPAYNEAAHLGATLDALLPYLRGIEDGAELVIVDDGSRDETGQIAAEAGESEPWVRVITHEKNLGKGRAVRTGMLAGEGTLRVFTDADLAYGVTGVKAIVATLSRGADLAVGVRSASTRRLLGAHPARAAASRLFAWIVREVALTGFTDTQCGLKGMTSSATDTVFAAAMIDGFGFDVEILCLAQMAGLGVSQVPVSTEITARRRSSSVRLLPAAGQMIRDTMRIRRWAADGLYDKLLREHERHLRDEDAAGPQGQSAE